MVVRHSCLLMRLMLRAHDLHLADTTAAGAHPCRKAASSLPPPLAVGVPLQPSALDLAKKFVQVCMPENDDSD
jgi:hypothetical protein